MGIKPNKMNKTDLIRAIQRSEGNVECYATDRVEHCGELRLSVANRLHAPRRKQGAKKI